VLRGEVYPDPTPQKETDLVTLAERVTLARERLGLNQSELARRAGLAVAAVWQFEHGDRAPSVRSLSKLAEALGVSTDWLLGRADAEEPIDPRLTEIMRGWERLSERDRIAIVQLYQVLAGG
jgi:transcriptional regulator with XRE-family HTH domain